jgi:hypothetical protein
LKQEIFPSRGILKNGESVEKNKKVKREIFTGENHQIYGR